ncbi:MAG: bacillithiol biosynthesis cysteine-adding enzyme BshC [Flavobacteriales bacterium CG_4_9_14_3_um_filter_40_17]|nr:MAG: bacillithiol biosynthesis cysteine-adding enzyme BshC [Flavobacteriales bacterium CG_4_9_14_3_um_filter_40_17]
MLADCIPFKRTGFFSPLILDYLSQNLDLKEFYGNFPSVDNFKNQFQTKEKTYQNNQRATLVSVLKKQYQLLEVSEATTANIESLSSSKTFTVTTGHQLNLFGGPLYFVYKIATTLNLARLLNEKYTEYHVVPIFWMATEDHDFAEINYFNFQNQKISWNRPSGGAVGSLSTEGLQAVSEVFEATLGKGKNARFLAALFQKTYLKHNKLAEATRYFVNELFKETELVIIDADNAEFKKEFVPVMEKELIEHTAFDKLSETNVKLKSFGYHIQVNPRKINLFYLQENHRGRIEKDESKGHYHVDGTDFRFDETQILSELHTHPERFSPNALMRPVYQESLLPNLCYIGGGGEIAYWLQLKSTFAQFGVTFPIVMLRNSVLLVSDKQAKKLQNLEISYEDIFLSSHELTNKKIKAISAIPIDFSTQKHHLKSQFESLYKLATQTDASFLGAVKAQEAKQTKGLENLEKRLLKAQKRKLEDEVNRLEKLKDGLFPNGGLQERTVNFSDFYLELGDETIPLLLSQLNPLDFRFAIVEI